MVSFQVKGPFKIPRKADSPHVEANRNLGDFWQETKVGERIGCYAFGTRTSKGLIKIWYVGKTTNGFEQECFQPHKREIYNDVLARHNHHGTPVMFFILPAQTNGQPPVAAIADLEIYLIQTAKAANPESKNQKHAKRPQWVVRGVTRAVGQGEVTKAISNFRRALRLKPPVAKE
ncbi:hypothetical protein [Acidiferrobacter sp.]|jgi:hypothetical protein|uniref:hypothetical protein n=1 Tax=Acidiferrobacter sp. TaxID=1872107 RepID=UPI0026092014|nr:hypothetical protein [Acidiferrobacter sp.]